ncbi:sugar ABC transporter ATP-binding protein [Patulibacter defluvii]|uniref:sugar ABC transporter ATP-binding protein n=1 Tax=Patulibacter defluvii TaxID=3095358 RepID=UPI002A763E98|nr:sugar ABC transporter ATP-binding protein [Patulibacter sp. DM4]
MSSPPLIELEDVGKRYAGVRALEGISLTIEAGTIHGLVGENGAGKSTLGRIVGGAVPPTSGTLRIDGRPVAYRSPREALRDGIAVIQQELALVPELSVRENVLLGTEPVRRGALDRAAARRRFDALEQRAGFGLRPDAIVAELPIAEQQKVEILRALARDARVIVMDEPTSSLAREEADQLHQLVRGLRDDGLAIVYVSHFLEQVIELADRVTVFRNGRLVETLDCAGLDVERLVVGMLGQRLESTFPAKRPPADDAPQRLAVRGLTRAGAIEDVSFAVRAGEIVGLAGLVGSGRSEVLRAIFGADPVDAGEVVVDGEPLPGGRPRRAIAAGVALAPEDRKRLGLLLEFSQRDNVALPHLRSLSRFGAVRRGEERRATGELLRTVGVSPPNPALPVQALSGGNQQKVMFAKWLLRRPRVLLLDEPTRGVDIGAKRAIYELIVGLAAEGMAVVVVSSDVEEVLGLAHRVLVMHRGRVGTELDTAELTSDAIVRASFGIEHRMEAAR